MSNIEDLKEYRILNKEQGMSNNTKALSHARQHFDIGYSLFLVRYSFKNIKHFSLLLRGSIFPPAFVYQAIFCSTSTMFRSGVCRPKAELFCILGVLY